MTKNKFQDPNSPKVDGRSKVRGILLRNFSAEDVTNKNPDLHQRLFVTFKPLGIEDKPDLIHQLIDDYSIWQKANNAELQAEKLKAQAEAIEKAKQMLIKQGIDPKTVFSGNL